MTEDSLADWPFDQPPSCGVLTLRQVLDGEEPILAVFHDADDHGWQFIGSSDASEDDAKLVALSRMLELDPTIREVADLQPGWVAFRDRPGSPWRRQRTDPDSE